MALFIHFLFLQSIRFYAVVVDYIFFVAVATDNSNSVVVVVFIVVSFSANGSITLLFTNHICLVRTSVVLFHFAIATIQRCGQDNRNRILISSVANDGKLKLPNLHNMLGVSMLDLQIS